MSHPLSFDAALPQLPIIADLDALSARFDAPAERVLDVKYVPNEHCTATVRLRGGSIGVVRVEPSGTVARLFHQDPAMPWLKRALDEREMAQRFHAAACRVVAVRYRPAERCVLRYEFGEGVHFGKCFAADPATLVATLQALARSSRPTVAAPLPGFADLRMVVQPATEGRELGAMAFDPVVPEARRLALFRDAGSNLAALHSQDGSWLERNRFADDLAELHSYTPIVRIAAPHVAASYERALASVAEPGVRGSAPVLSHGAFRTDQFLVDSQGRFALIDLDSASLADPARDLGNVAAYLGWKAIRRPADASFAAAANGALEDGYASERPLPDRAALRLFTRLSSLKIAGRRFRSLSIDEWDWVPALLDAAAV